MAKASDRQRNRFYQIVGIGCLTFAVLSFVSLFSNSTGVVGEFVVKAVNVVAGEGKYVFPLVIAFLGVKMMMEWHKARFEKEMLVGVALLFALVLVLLHLQLDTAQKDLTKVGIQGEGGGIIGGVLSAILLTAFGRTGTYIILVALVVIAVMLTTNISFPTMWKFVSGQAVMIWNRIRDMVSGFIFTEVEEDDEDTVPEVLPKKTPEKRRVLFDSSIFNFGKEQDEDITVKAEEDDFPKINIYPEPIEKILANEENRERADVISIEERKTRSKKTESQKDGTPQLPTSSTSNFSLPPLTLFSKNTKTRSPRMNKDITDNVRILEDTLESFGVKAKVTQVSRGPAITRYEIQPAPGVKVSRIVNLADDISLGLAASGVRIEAPIPGKAAVGIEVPNKEISVVTMRELLESEEFAKASSKLAFVLGKDIAGTTILADLAQMPHLLIAGATGSGKSVCMNTLIASILFRARPDEVKLLMIDPKMVELTTYNGIPHLISPVVTDSKKAATSLRWAVREMEKRYEHFARSGVKDIYRFNQAVKAGNAEYESGFMPFIMVVIDELADLMMVAPADVEDAICRLAQMARAAGMHLVVATQRPSVDVITGLIKANIPSRIAFAVSSQTDSRTILDMAGAEKLLGKGDMLFFPVGAVKPIRVQGAFMSDKEVEALVSHLKQQGVPQFEEGVIQDDSHSAKDSGEVDELFKEAVQILIESGQASISMLQRRLRIGYARAARLIDMMEERGIVGKYEGSKPRALLMTMEQFIRTFGDEP
ncbi:DNA translocase FtsK [Phosphitispora fastidiosa]|uniref:DNA translocase FtsK n=1 Tax=Phosphitispora fastidiosa TaxID=2837202 RepID=UPI001E606B4F|nr:DNA translocase FtsK [Phosphitispora fastidiosa]MBU7005554.1 S-DNA-T family DNA segregation ATPase FtsK/SpoIIIE [Phosphitispora fastidiosa]